MCIRDRIELFKDTRLRCRRNTYSIVCDFSTDACVFFFEADGKDSVVMGKLDGVGKQVDPHLLEHLFISRIFYGFHIDIKFKVFCSPLVFKEQKGVPDLLVEMCIRDSFYCEKHTESARAKDMGNIG